MKKEVKNHAKSVKTRLLNLMNTTGYQYMYLLARYFNERLLYRVSVSSYKDNFLLKGGSLLFRQHLTTEAWSEIQTCNYLLTLSLLTMNDYYGGAHS